jgi:hypothetical protein
MTTTAITGEVTMPQRMTWINCVDYRTLPLPLWRILTLGLLEAENHSGR